MRKLRILFFLSALTIGTISCKKTQDSFTINGEISGFDDGTKLVLVCTHDRDQKPIAESSIENGKFQFVGKMDEPKFCNIKVENMDGSIYLMVDNENISIKAKALLSEYDGEKYYEFKSLQISDSKIQLLYEQKIAFARELDELYQKGAEKHKKHRQALYKAQDENNQARVDSLRASDEGKSATADQELFFKTVDEKLTQAVLTNKDSWWGPFIALSYFNDFDKKVNDLYSQFSQEAKDSYYGKFLYEELHPKTVLSQVTPAFTLSDKNEKFFSSADLMKGKKYTIIDFWASWCAPCREEVPNLKQIYKRYASKGLQIISVSVDKKKDEWLKALEEEKMPWPNLLDNDKSADKYFVKAIPALFLVDENGVVLFDDLRGETLASKVDELFK